jgi:hypothetical protein
MPTDEEKLWAKHVVSLTPGKPSVTKYWDDEEKYSVDIMTISTDSGKICTTIGLSKVVQWPDSNPPIRSEILAGSKYSDIKIENVISTAAFFILKDGWRIKPGAVFEEIVSWYIPDQELKHLLFIEQYQWGKEMSSFEAGAVQIFPLLAVPITERERVFVKEAGLDALQSIWQKHQVDVCDWARGSAV